MSDKADADNNLDRRTIFVRSIPFDATSEQLSEYFSQFVPVRHAVVVTDENQKSRGFGFVSFTMDDDTVTALVEAKKTKFQGRYLRVDIAKRRDRKDKSKDKDAEPKIEREPVEKRKARLIIRNIPWSLKEPEKLKKIFSRFGAVHDAYIPKKSGGQMRGFAFVTMVKHAAAQKAVEGTKGLKIDGREVAVDLALEKSKWEQVKDEQEVPKFETKDDEDEESKNTDDSDEAEDSSDDGEESSEEGDSDEDDSDSDSDSDDFDKLNDLESDEEDEDDKPKANKQESYSVFVRNIPYDADEESLKEHFSKFGPVKYALPVREKETGLAKGSAFVAFYKEETYNECLENAPTTASTSILIPDDVAPEYVYQGRILSIAPTVDRLSASRLAERNSEKRKEVLGKGEKNKDKRNLFLLNEGRITTNSKLAQFLTPTDIELREKSYKLRVQQLNKNPSLHLSLTRLAIRNLPRAMNSKALKALGRKAVVQFATEVKEEKRQPLSKEEVNRSIKLKHELGELETKSGVEENDGKKKKAKHKGVVKQAKVVQEVKGSGETGRSRGYGFIEFRDHKTALMGLRWLNAHEVTPAEIIEGMTEDEKKIAELSGISKRRLIVEFAVENAEVVKRRREKVFLARSRHAEAEEGSKRGTKRKQDDEEEKAPKKTKNKPKKGNMNKGQKEKPDSGISDDVKQIIGMKRKRRKTKK